MSVRASGKYFILVFVFALLLFLFGTALSEWSTPASRVECLRADAAVLPTLLPSPVASPDTTTMYTAASASTSFSPSPTIITSTPSPMRGASSAGTPEDHNFIFCGGPTSDVIFGVDDQIVVSVNGQEVFRSPKWASQLYPFSFYAQSGDLLNVRAYDVYGVAYSLWPLWLYHIPTGQSIKLTGGVAVHYTNESGFLFFDQTWTIPDFGGENPGLDPTEPQVPDSGGCNGTPSSTVSAKSGNNLVTDTDLSHNSLGPSFAFSRAYSSMWSYNGPLGYGWTHAYNTSLKLNDDGSVVESDEVGTPHRYTIQSAGAYTAPPGRNATLVRNADGSFALTEKDQRVKKFSAAGVLLSLTDANGNAMTMGYDPSGKLIKITDAAGREALLSYTAEGKIAEITDPAQRKVRYFYDADSNMVRVNDVIGLDTVYEYTNHKLTKITMFNGKTYTYSYDSEGRLVSRTDMADQQTKIAYDPVTKTSTVTDRRGNKTVYTMDDQGRQVSVVDPTGAETRQTWDANNNITTLTDPRGGVQEFTHDRRGNVLTHKDQLGQVTTYTYTDKNQVATVKDALGKTQQFVYDAKSNLLKVIDPRGNTLVTSTYNTKGERTSTTDMLGHTTRFEMDQYGNVVKEIDALGHETRHTFDIVDRMTGTINAKGKTTSFTYGVKDQLLSTTYPDGTSTTNEWYPCCALLKSVTDAKGATTVYNYNAQRQLIKVTDAAQGVTQFELDENGNKTAIIDPKGSRTALVYDKANRLEKIAYPDGTSEVFTYYPGGLLKTKTDGNGAVISLVYDPAGRLTRKSYPDGSAVEFAYNAVGVRTSMTDASGIYRYTVDDLYRLTGVTLPSGKKIGYSYNNAGQRVGMTDYDSKKYAYQYDKLNRLTTLTLPGNEKVDYSYDPLSALSKVSYPNNTFTSYTLDSMNRVKEIATYRKGHFKNTLVSGFSYSHDLVGNVISREDRSPCGRPQKTLFTYDPLYRLASVAYPDKSEESYTYDLASNRAIRETKKLHLASCFNGWKWDEKGCRDLVRCLFHPEYITFHAQYSYDAANKLLGIEETKLFRDITKPYRTTAYEFDRNGNQVRESILNEGCTKAVENLFTYNADNRLIEARMKGIKKYQFSYDGEGRRYRTLVESVKPGGGHHASRCLAESQETGHLYDGSSMIMDIDAKGRPTASYSYGLGLTGITAGRFKGFMHADMLGSITEITGREGNPLRSYRYDAWGEMTAGETAHDVNPFRYVGAYGVSWQDNTLGMYHCGARFYNPQAGRFVSKDPMGYRDGLNLYTYVRNNPVNWIDPVGLAGQQQDTNAVAITFLPNPWTTGSSLSLGLGVALEAYLVYTHLPQNVWMINEPWCPGYQFIAWLHWQEHGYRTGVSWEVWLMSQGIPPKNYWLSTYGLYPRPPVKPNEPTPPWPPFSSPIMRHI